MEAIVDGLRQFAVTVAAAVATGANQGNGELDWLAGAMTGAMSEIDKQIEKLQLDRALPEEDGLANGILLREMAYICVKFRNMVLETYPPGSAPFSDNPNHQNFFYGTENVEPVSMISPTDMQVTETVIGSLGKVYDWLPGWAKKILDTLSEGVKIIRLLTG
jgi:hypothetical protein